MAHLCFSTCLDVCAMSLFFYRMDNLVIYNCSLGIIRVQAKVIIKVATEAALKITTKIATEINENMVQVVLVNIITNLLKNPNAESLNPIKHVFFFLVLKKCFNFFLTRPPTSYIPMQVYPSKITDRSETFATCLQKCFFILEIIDTLIKIFFSSG